MGGGGKSIVRGCIFSTTCVLQRLRGWRCDFETRERVPHLNGCALLFDLRGQIACGSAVGWWVGRFNLIRTKLHLLTQSSNIEWDTSQLLTTSIKPTIVIAQTAAWTSINTPTMHRPTSGSPEEPPHGQQSPGGSRPLLEFNQDREIKEMAIQIWYVRWRWLAHSFNESSRRNQRALISVQWDGRKLVPGA